MAKDKVKKPESPKPKGVTLTKEFDFLLTEAELANRAKEMARLSGEAVNEEVALAKVNAEKRQRIKELYSDLDKIAAAVREGRETRMCEAIMTKDLAVGIVQFWCKNDKGQYYLLEERAMTDSERQGDLEIQQPHPKSAKKPKGEPAQLEPADDDISNVRKLETGRKTKRSALDGVHA